MARLRFPGCPGQRIGRNVVTYEENRNRSLCDPSLSVVSNLQRSLSSFYELFGTSDEDKEFRGFSARDVRNAVHKLRQYNDDISSEPGIKDEPSSSSKAASLRSTSKLVGRTNNLPPDPGGRNDARDSKVPKLDKASRARHQETPSSAGQTKGEGARKTPGRRAARRLLDRAKRGCAWTVKEERSERGGAALALKIGCFQLPAVSARSSRRIIPRKRYLEDSEEDIPRQLLKKRPLSQPTVEVTGDSPVVVLERLTASEERTVEDRKLDVDRNAELDARLGGELGVESVANAEGESGTAGTARVGLFDRPLVVQGKRPWKPSLKVQMRLSEANLGSPFTFRGGSGSSHGGSRTSSDSCCRESIKRDMVSRYAEIMATKEDTVEVPANSPPGTSGLLEDKVAAKIERLLKSQWENRLQGGTGSRKKNVVLRKARLRLSQRTLRRLRQPLDESPGEEGPREVHEQVGDPGLAEGPARTQRERPHVSRVKREGSASLTEVSQCAVCGQSKPSAEITVKYGQRSCRFCFCFYSRFLKKPRKFRCTGELPGTCDLGRVVKCKSCLLNACWTLFEIPATQKRHLQRHLVPPLSGRPKHRQAARKCRSSEIVGKDGLGAEAPSEMPKPVLSSPEDSQDAQISNSDSSKVSKGPRIKHVCRRAAVVLGHERATFSPPPGRISLSALSEEDKNLLVRCALEDTDSSPDKKDDVDKRKRRGKEERVKEREEKAKEKEREKEERVKEREEKAKEKERAKDEKERVKAEKERDKEKDREQTKETRDKLKEREQAKETRDKAKEREQAKETKDNVKEREQAKETKDKVKEEEKAVEVKEEQEDESVGRRQTRRISRNPLVVNRLRRARKGRCNQCAGCLAKDCGRCMNCRDKKKFGGKNLLKQACSLRRCRNPVLASRGDMETPESTAEKAADAPDRSATSSEVASDTKTSVTSGRPRKPSLALQKKHRLASPLLRYKSKLEQYRLLVRTAAKKAKSKGKPKVTSKVRAAMVASRVARKNGRPKGGLVTMRGAEGATEQCEFKLEEGTGCDAAIHIALTNRDCDRDVGSMMHSLERVGGASSLVGKLQDKSQPKAYPPLVPKVVEHPLSSRQLSKKSVGHGNQPLVQSLFGEEEYRRAQIIATGFALVSSRRFAVQAVCFLCASAGEEELLFCTVCCEPYHWFCLDPEEAPQGLDKESWCCPRCQTCIACGHRSSQLLRCSKCQQTYHTDCLGPGYPSKPSRKKKIWLCVKCIRCKSCGTSSKQSAWNFDLSLCQDCMLLREKGNYCPLCEKCYEDDDYESMMVQCSQCQKWIHARCDGISEELYQVLSLLPETELYLCRICAPNSPRLWLGTAERVLQDRLRCIMNSLLELQKASKDKCQVLEQAVPTPPDLLMLPDEAMDRDPTIDSVQPMAVWRTEIHFVDLIAVQRKLECGEYTAVKEFCEDILQAAIASRVSVQMVRELLAKLLEEAFPGLRPSPLPPTPPHEPSDMPCGLLPDAVLPPHADHVYAQYLPKEDSPPVDQPGVLRGCEQGSLADSRRCVLCCQSGDDACTRSGRLIYAGQDDWVHVNCALWSAEVFEHVDGSLHRVHSAIWRGRCLRCEVCGNMGATVGCCVRGCPANFHFGCARTAQAVFQADRKVFCTLHQSNINREVVDGDKFAVCHAVYISQQDVNSKWQKVWQEKMAKGISVITGSMTIENLGHLTEASDLENVLVPINYRCRRLFWSTQNPRQRVVYTCRTYEVRPVRPPPQEEDWGVNVTTAHVEEPYAPLPFPPPREGPQCDIASASCDSSRVGAVSSSDAFGADAPSQSSPDLDDLDAKILDELAKCVQGNDSHLDFAELLENISRSCDPAKGCSGGSGANSAGGDYEAPPVPDQPSAVAQLPPARQNGAVASAKTADTSSSPSEEQKRDCAKASAEARAGATAPQPPPPASRGANCGVANTNPSQKCTKPVKQPQSSCGCTCEGRGVGRTAGKGTSTTPSRARSRPTASPKTILPKVAGAQGCQRVRACQMPHQQQQQVAQATPQASCMGLPPVAQPPPLDLSRLVSYSPYAYNIPVINQYPSTINMTSVSCDKFEVYEVPGGTIIIPRHHYRLENCVSTLSVAGAQVAYLGSLPLVAAPFMQPAATPLAFIGGLGNQAPVMPLALQPPGGVCGQMPLVAGSGLVANPGMVGPGLTTSNLVASMTSSTMVNNIPGSTNLVPPCSVSSMQRMAPCCAADQRKKTVVTQKQCTKSLVVRNRVVQSSRGGGKAVVTQSRSSFVSQQQCTKCVVMPEHSPRSVTVSELPKVSEVGPTPAVSTTAALPTVSPAAPPPLPTRSTTSPDLYPEPDSSTAEDLFCGPGRVSPDLLPPPQPPFSPSPQASPRGAGDSGSLGAESIFALLQKAAQRILQDGWPTDADTDPVPPPPTLEAKEPVHSTVNLPTPLPQPQESQDRAAPFDRPYIVYEISSEDGFLHSSHDVHEAWRYVFEKLQDARAAANLQPLTADDVDGFAMMGLTHKTVVYLTEQLKGADNCVNYCFKFHKRNCVKLAENPSGCARLEQFESRGDHDMFKFLASAHRCPPRYDPSESGEQVEVLHKSSRRLTSLDLPMAMRFRHLKNTAKEAVGVYRSNIHGRGLYCKRNIDGGEMIIEYAGEVIRAALTDKREKYYESKGIGCYMFRIDDHEVVDATMHGNAARFINHSCEPNCYSKVITVDNKKHIVIFALRSILKGEELTYDYKFPIEEVKIPCMCGSRRCRKFLN